VQIVHPAKEAVKKNRAEKSAKIGLSGRTAKFIIVSGSCSIVDPDAARQRIQGITAALIITVKRNHSLRTKANN